VPYSTLTWRELNEDTNMNVTKALVIGSMMLAATAAATPVAAAEQMPEFYFDSAAQ
jgi:hypothetical protein